MTENFTAKTQRTQRFKGVFLCVLRVFAVKTLFSVMFNEPYYTAADTEKGKKCPKDIF
jgi:hypothetical protein